MLLIFFQTERYILKIKEYPHLKLAESKLDKFKHWCWVDNYRQHYSGKKEGFNLHRVDRVGPKGDNPCLSESLKPQYNSTFTDDT